MATTKTSTNIVHNYAVGEAVECLDIGRHARWRPACVTSLAPVRGKPGYYIIWTDIDWAAVRANKWARSPSSGGWVWELVMRKVGGEAA